MTIFDDDNKPSVNRGSGLVDDLDEATDMGSYDTNAYAQKREAKSGRNIMGLAAMLADANMRGGAGVSNLDTSYAEGNGTEYDEIMDTTQSVEDTGHSNLLPQVAGTAGSDIAADGSPPTATSA